ncbi:MAG: hypothetical protein ABIP42_01625 [Planctomycetota bacterium]
MTPLYVPASLYLHVKGPSEARLERIGALMEKLSASSVAASCVGLMFLLLRRRVSHRDALLLAAAFGFATNTWVTSSQALWQHGTGELLLTCALLGMTREPAAKAVAAAGFFAGLLAANRPPDVVLAASLGAYAVFWARGKIVPFVAGAILPLGATVAYNWIVFRNLTGGYGQAGIADASFFMGSTLFMGVAGLLFSPGKGLFFYAPFLLFLPVLFHRSLADRRFRLLSLCLTGGAILQLLLYAQTDWRAGFSWGPRFLVDLLPALVFLLAPVLPTLSRPSRALFLACCAWSVFAQGVGAFMYQGASDAILYERVGPRAMENAWNPALSPILIEARQSPARMSLLPISGTLRGPAGDHEELSTEERPEPR